MLNVVNELSKYMTDRYMEKWYNFLSIIKINKKIKKLSKQLKDEDIFKCCSKLCIKCLQCAFI